MTTHENEPTFSEGPKPASPLPWVADIDDGTCWTGKFCCGEGDDYCSWLTHSEERGIKYDVKNATTVAFRVTHYPPLYAQWKQDQQTIGLLLDKTKPFIL